ncbi:hypothetical protein P153DRAFT_184260 [Dothidotthia symphoricarpi CBS 119687]|uniref:Uncharacterized protein n=1 Tax=Dothidotthia symphoricarpi CBS 119687 TaxID=1392245 RepID=A0A6A6ANN4_9PLEO|nr:uncharacterized protein P153DRAFT_184260 [Dothidotthia symphoricarpi CBS 119687]KAF2132101.1 hypothetical protein P153DRAFT_184260 [Dothidotthia symphoricarpi CBS 119687]
MPRYTTPIISTFYITILILLTFLSTPTIARPGLRTRGLPGAVYVCDGTDFSGNCAWRPPEDNCIIVSSAKSIGPDPDGRCTLFQKFDCTGEVQTLDFPGAGSGLPTFQAIKCTANESSKRSVVEREEIGVENENRISVVEGNLELAEV